MYWYKLRGPKVTLEEVVDEIFFEKLKKFMCLHVVVSFYCSCGFSKFISPGKIDIQSKISARDKFFGQGSVHSKIEYTL